MGTANGKLRGQLGKIRGAVDPAAKRTRNRLVKSVGRKIFTVPLKALPYAGLPIVAGLTVWEINDLCATIQDMDEIRRAAGESKAEAESEPADCSRPDLAVKCAIGKIGNSSWKAWADGKRFVPDLPSLEELRSLWPDGWRGAWDSIKRILP